MSTTFHVYPGTPALPTFAELIDRSTRELHQFLASIGIGARPPIHLRLQRRADHRHLTFRPRDPFRWDRDAYAWFMVGDVPGGTDAYCDEDSARIVEDWQRELDDPKFQRLGPLIRECIAVGHGWWFRRSAGQPPIISLAYGLIAGSLAAITGGFVYSDDSAWDWERMPARPEEFLKVYFRPEQALEADFRDWSRQCLAEIARELPDRDP